MTLNLALSLLRQGRNGEQILSILESIAAPDDVALRERMIANGWTCGVDPTADPIQF